MIFWNLVLSQSRVLFSGRQFHNGNVLVMRAERTRSSSSRCATRAGTRTPTTRCPAPPPATPPTPRTLPELEPYFHRWPSTSGRKGNHYYLMLYHAIRWTHTFWNHICCVRAFRYRYRPFRKALMKIIPINWASLFQPEPTDTSTQIELHSASKVSQVKNHHFMGVMFRERAKRSLLFAKKIKKIVTIISV